jgi:hypothetical protein
VVVVVVVVLRRIHVGKYQQSGNSPSFGFLLHDGALVVAGNYTCALVAFIQNQANLQVQGCTLASCCK